MVFTFFTHKGSFKIPGIVRPVILNLTSYKFGHFENILELFLWILFRFGNLSNCCIFSCCWTNLFTFVLLWPGELNIRQMLQNFSFSVFDLLPGLICPWSFKIPMHVFEISSMDILIHYRAVFAKKTWTQHQLKIEFSVFSEISSSHSLWSCCLVTH